MAETTWNTAITSIAPNEVRIRGYDIAGLMGNMSFGAAVYLILRGELPDEPVSRLMDAILIASIDHGATPPSCLATRNAASTGAPLSAAVASGILAINRFHGGAIEDCANQLARVIDRTARLGGTLEDAAAAELAEMKSRGERMSGFGHRVHDDDPRTQRLFELAERVGGTGRDWLHVHAARAVEHSLLKSGKALPINVDGAIAAVLADLGFEPGVMNGMFMIARCAGLVAHAQEERERERPMRRIDPGQARYDGPPAR